MADTVKRGTPRRGAVLSVLLLWSGSSGLAGREHGHARLSRLRLSYSNLTELADSS